jgi:hypothetical protein
VFTRAREAGADPQPVGANEMVLPDDTDPAVLRRLFGDVATGSPAAAKAKPRKASKEI